MIASLADVSHIVIDEVHERSLDTDFLLTIIREVMKAKKDLLKLVLMSATLDAASFKDYFVLQGLNVGLVEIEGRTYPVEDFYLDDVVSMTGFKADFDDSNEETLGKTIQKLGHRINYPLLAETVSTIDLELAYQDKEGGVLVFLPGVAEINQVCRQLSNNSSLHVLPLHASLETREQKRVFAKPPPGKRKVVVATNVAETSITIDDIVAVVDSGKVKETTYDPQNNMRKLEEMWASRAACKQRRGRAGRVQAGKCYKLYTRKLEGQMAERPEPEIRRVPLEQMCLSVRAMGLRDVAAFLARSPTPPESTAVEGAINLLRSMGALDGDELTALGQQLAMIPADLRCAKLMVYGAIFGCLDDSVTISAILSSRSPFLSPPDKRNLAKEARMRLRARGRRFADRSRRLQGMGRHATGWCALEATPDVLRRKLPVLPDPLRYIGDSAAVLHGAGRDRHHHTSRCAGRTAGARSDQQDHAACVDGVGFQPADRADPIPGQEVRQLGLRSGRAGPRGENDQVFHAGARPGVCASEQHRIRQPGLLGQRSVHVVLQHDFDQQDIYTRADT